MKRFLGILVLGLLLTQFQYQTLKANHGITFMDGISMAAVVYDGEDLLKAQIIKTCMYEGGWSIPLGLPLDADIIVRVKLEFDQDKGFVNHATLINPRVNERWTRNIFRVLASSAMRAIMLCQPRNGYFDTVPTKHLWLNLNWRKAQEAKEKKAQTKQLAKAEEERKKQAYDNSPEGQLHNAYVYYMVIKGFYESRKGYVMQYLTSEQMLDARSKTKEIEDTIVKENKIDENEIWHKAEKYYVAEWGSTIDSVKASGEYTEYLSSTVKNRLIALSKNHKKVTGGTRIEKDF